MHTSLFYQLPIYNLFTQHVIYLLWRDTTSELWTPVLFSLLIYNHINSVYFLQYCSLFYCKHFFPHYTVNPLYSANRWDWQPHWIVGAKYLGCVVCKFHVVADAIKPFSGAVAKSASHTFRSDSLLLLVRLNLGFLMRENLLLCSSYLPLGVPNGSLLASIKLFFWRRCRGEEALLRGVCHSQSFYFVIVLLILFLFAFLYRKYKKNWV